MANKALPSPEELRQLLRYEPETGKLFWLPRPIEMFSEVNYCETWNTRYAKREALCTNNGHGYLVGNIFDRTMLAHRAAWCIYHGYWPDQVDHINLNKSDNRIINLREANNSQNRCNVSLRSDNKSGVKGVSWNNSSGKWVSQIQIMRKTIHLGYFENKEDAAKAYSKASNIYHGNFGRTS